MGHSHKSNANTVLKQAYWAGIIVEILYLVIGNSPPFPACLDGTEHALLGVTVLLKPVQAGLGFTGPTHECHDSCWNTNDRGKLIVAFIDLCSQKAARSLKLTRMM